MPTAPSIGAQKLGQPLPEWNFLGDFEQGRVAARAEIGAVALLGIERTGAGELGAVAA